MLHMLFALLITAESGWCALAGASAPMYIRQDG